MTDGLDKATMANAYARWAPIYDLVFGKVFDEGRKSTIAVSGISMASVLGAAAFALAVVDGRQSRFASPVSSSSVMKITPAAVPGR